MTRTQPESVLNVVSSTLVSGKYRRWVENGMEGANSSRPPFDESTTAANTGMKSNLGTGNQSMAPSPATRAMVRPSPIGA